MHSILTSSDQVIRRVSIHYGCGRTATPERVQSDHTWALIERLLNTPNRHNSIVVDYFEDSPGRNHPLLHGPLFEDQTIAPDNSDRVHHATLYPTPNTVWFDNLKDPQFVHLIARKLQVSVKRNDQNWSTEITAITALHLPTGKLTITS